VLTKSTVVHLRQSQRPGQNVGSLLALLLIRATGCTDQNHRRGCVYSIASHPDIPLPRTQAIHEIDGRSRLNICLRFCSSHFILHKCKKTRSFCGYSCILCSTSRFRRKSSTEATLKSELSDSSSISSPDIPNCDHDLHFVNFTSSEAMYTARLITLVDCGHSLS